MSMKMLKTEEAAEMMGIPWATLAVMRHKGVGPAYYKDATGAKRRIYYAEKDVKAWMAGHSLTGTLVRV